MLVKRSKISTQQPKYFENPNIVDIRSVTVEDLVKLLVNYSRLIRQAEKISQLDTSKSSNRPLYSETKTVNFF